MTFVREASFINYEYSVDGVKLERVYKIKDLGVTFLPNLSFRDHISDVVNSASRTIGFLKR